MVFQDQEMEQAEREHMQIQNLDKDQEIQTQI